MNMDKWIHPKENVHKIWILKDDQNPSMLNSGATFTSAFPKLTIMLYEWK